jgi:hypothetical protein
MPWDEALKRAGSLEALRPHLCAGNILARHNGLYYWPDGKARSGPGNITRGLWADARVDPATQRVIFTMLALVRMFWADSRPDDPPPLTEEVFAIGIELERTAVEALFPAAPKPSGRKRGAKPSAAWAKVQPHFDHLVDRNGPFPSLGSARDAVKLFLEEKRLGLMDDRTIERWINRHRPQWRLEGA